MWGYLEESYISIHSQYCHIAVKNQTCADPGCTGVAYFDGADKDVLNMGFLIHHEVLRDYMFHFLYARLVLIVVSSHIYCYNACAYHIST